MIVGMGSIWFVCLRYNAFSQGRFVCENEICLKKGSQTALDFTNLFKTRYSHNFPLLIFSLFWKRLCQNSKQSMNQVGTELLGQLKKKKKNHCCNEVIFSFDSSLWTTYLEGADLHIHWKGVEPHRTDEGYPAQV